MAEKVMAGKVIVGKCRRTFKQRLSWFVLLLGTGALLGELGAIAMPPDDTTFTYLKQKYSLPLGDTRGACGYYIDPADVRQYGTTRVLTAKISRGSTGTACSGVLTFRLLQVDCDTNTLYELQLEGAGRDATWRTEPLTLYPNQSGNSPGNPQTAAEKVCTLPAQPGDLPSRSGNS